MFAARLIRVGWAHLTLDQVREEVLRHFTTLVKFEML